MKHGLNNLWLSWFFQKKRLDAFRDRVNLDNGKAINVFKPPRNLMDTYDIMEEHFQAGQMLSAKSWELAQKCMERCEEAFSICVNSVLKKEELP